MTSIEDGYVVQLFCACLGIRMMLVSEFVSFRSQKHHLKKFKSEINVAALHSVPSSIMIWGNHVCLVQ